MTWVALLLAGAISLAIAYLMKYPTWYAVFITPAVLLVGCVIIWVLRVAWLLLPYILILLAVLLVVGWLRQKALRSA
jgi:hypothetical protein